MLKSFFSHRTTLNKKLVTVIIILLVAGFGAKLVSYTFAASVIIPPNEPSFNVDPNPNFLNTAQCGAYSAVDIESSACFSAVQQAASNARAIQEGLGPLFSPQQLSILQSMPVNEQQFVLVNFERVSRGLPPIAGMTAQLNLDAQGGANANADPDPQVGNLTGGAPEEYGGADWCGGWNSYECDYYYMYDDGLGSNNIDCTASNTAGCWGHRNNILAAYNTSCTGEQMYMGAAYTTSSAPSNASYAFVIVGACGPAPTDITYTWNQALAAIGSPGSYSIPTSSNPVPGNDGYWEVASDGGIFSFGNAPFDGSTGNITLNQPVTGMAETPDGGGYWMVAADGGVFSFGNAGFSGSAVPYAHSGGFVGMAAYSDSGYWLVDSTGQIFAFGGAPYFGGSPKNYSGNIVGIAATPDRNGYWLVTSFGQIYTYGDAQYYGGSPGVSNIVGMVASPGGGYWLVGSDGGVFSYNAPYYGSAPGLGYHVNNVVGISRLADGGYAVDGSDGSSFWFSAGGQSGTIAGRALNKPVVGGAGAGVQPTTAVATSPTVAPKSSLGGLSPGAYQAIYALGTDGSVWQNEYSGSAWTTFGTMGHALVPFKGSVSYGYDQNGRAIVYAVGTDGNAYSDDWNGTRWTGWSSFGKPSATVSISNITVGRNFYNQPNLFATASNGNVYQDTMSGGNWSGWQSIGHPLTATLTSGISYGPIIYNLPAVYVVGSDGNVWETYNNTKTWVAWINLGKPSVGIKGAVTNGFNQNKAANLFATGADGIVYQDWYTGTGWSGWQPIGANPRGLTFTNGVAATKNQAGNDMITAIASDGNAYQDYWTGLGWSGWQPIGRGGSILTGAIAMPPYNNPGKSQPVVLLGSPTNNATYSLSNTNSITISGAILANNKIVEWRVYINGVWYGGNGPILGGPNMFFSWTWNLKPSINGVVHPVATGTYNIQGQAFDTQDGTGSSSVVTIKITK